MRFFENENRNQAKRQSGPLELLMLEGETISQDLQSDQNIIFYRGGDVRG